MTSWTIFAGLVCTLWATDAQQQVGSQPPASAATTLSPGSQSTPGTGSGHPFFIKPNNRSQSQPQQRGIKIVFECLTGGGTPEYRRGVNISVICPRGLKLDVINENSTAVDGGRVAVYANDQRSREGAHQFGVNATHPDLHINVTFTDIDPERNLSLSHIFLKQVLNKTLPCGPGYLLVELSLGDSRPITKFIPFLVRCNTSDSDLKITILKAVADGQQRSNYTIITGGDRTIRQQLASQGCTNITVNVTNIGSKSLGPRSRASPFAVGMWLTSENRNIGVHHGGNMSGHHSGNMSRPGNMSMDGGNHGMNGDTDNNTRCNKRAYQLGDSLLGETLIPADKGLPVGGEPWTFQVALDQRLTFRGDERPICGPAKIVLMVDPSFDIHDSDRCNNFATIDVIVDCNSITRPTVCSVISNPLTQGHEALLQIAGGDDNQSVQFGGNQFVTGQPHGSSFSPTGSPMEGVTPEGTRPTPSGPPNGQFTTAGQFSQSFSGNRGGSHSPYILYRTDGDSDSFEPIYEDDGCVMRLYGRIQYLLKRYNAWTKAHPGVCSELKKSESEQEEQQAKKIVTAVKDENPGIFHSNQNRTGAYDSLVDSWLISLGQGHLAGLWHGHRNATSPSGTGQPQSSATPSGPTGTGGPLNGTTRPSDTTGTWWPLGVGTTPSHNFGGTGGSQGLNCNEHGSCSQNSNNFLENDSSWGCGYFPLSDDLDQLGSELKQVLFDTLEDQFGNDEDGIKVDRRFKDGLNRTGTLSSDVLANLTMDHRNYTQGRNISRDAQVLCKPEGKTKTALMKPEYQFSTQVGMATCCTTSLDNEGASHYGQAEKDDREDRDHTHGCGQEYLKDVLKILEFDKSYNLDIGKCLIEEEDMFSRQVFQDIQSSRKKQPGGRGNQTLSTTPKDGATVTTSPRPPRNDSMEISEFVLPDKECRDEEGRELNPLTPDDVFPIYWRVHNGAIMRGVKDPLNPSYGREETPICWSSVAACECESCRADQESSLGGSQSGFTNWGGGGQGGFTNWGGGGWTGTGTPPVSVNPPGWTGNNNNGGPPTGTPGPSINPPGWTGSNNNGDPPTGTPGPSVNPPGWTGSGTPPSGGSPPPSGGSPPPSGGSSPPSGNPTPR